MDCQRLYCRCCYSAGELETLSIPSAEVYALICNVQGLEDDNTQIVACLLCRQFLEEVDRFSIGRHAVDEDFCNSLDVKPHELDLPLRTLNHENSSQIYTEKEIKYEINVEADADLKTLQEISERPPESFLVPNLYKREIQFGNPFNPIHGGLLVERNDYRPNEVARKMITKSVAIEKITSHSRMDKSSRSLVKRASKEKHLECDGCSFICKSKNDMIAHQIIHSKQNLGVLLNICEKGNKKLFKCNQCSFEALYPYTLREHFSRNHSDKKSFSCDQCNYSCKTRTQVYRHIKYKHSIKKLKCNQCSYETIYNQHLKNHIASKHSDEKPFSCEECNYRSKTKDDLYAHKKRIHSPKKLGKCFKCNRCSFETIYSQCLRQHIACNHSDEKPFSCDHCNYRCKTKAKIYLHMQYKHSLTKLVKRFKCNQCSYETLHSNNLKMHIARKHSDEKPYSCDQCNYRCKTKGYLSIHKKDKH